MFDNNYQGINDRDQIKNILERLIRDERALNNRFTKIQIKLKDNYNDVLRKEYLDVQTELILLKKNIEMARKRSAELEEKPKI